MTTLSFLTLLLECRVRIGTIVRAYTNKAKMDGWMEELTDQNKKIYKQIYNSVFCTVVLLKKRFV